MTIIEKRGRVYTLIHESQLTNRLFSGCFIDAQEGESYTSEWSAFARADNNRKVKIVWRFEVVKGAEPEPDTHDWDNEDAITIIEI